MLYLVIITLLDVLMFMYGVISSLSMEQSMLRERKKGYERMFETDCFRWDHVSSVSWLIVEKERAWASRRGRKQILSRLRVSDAGHSLTSRLMAKLWLDGIPVWGSRLWLFKLCFEILWFQRPSAPSIDGTFTLTFHFWIKWTALFYHVKNG